MYDVLISGKKAAIGIIFLQDGAVKKSLRILIKKPENADVNKADLLGVKYALLAIVDKSETIQLHLNPYPLKMLNPKNNPSVNVELIAEVKKLAAGFKNVVVHRLCDHIKAADARLLSTVAEKAPDGTVVIGEEK